MKLTYQQLMNARPALTNLGAERLPLKKAYSISKNLQKLDTEIRTFEGLRLEIFRRHGKEDNQGMIQVLQEHQKEFEEDITELLLLEIEVEVIQINLEDVDCKMSAVDLMNLDWMIMME